MNKFQSPTGRPQSNIFVTDIGTDTVTISPLLLQPGPTIFASSAISKRGMVLWLLLPFVQEFTFSRHLELAMIKVTGD